MWCHCILVIEATVCVKKLVCLPPLRWISVSMVIECQCQMVGLNLRIKALL